MRQIGRSPLPGTAGGTSDRGHARFPDNLAPVSATDALAFKAGLNRSSNAVVALGTGGAIAIYPNATGATHVIVDVVGYFQ